MVEKSRIIIVKYWRQQCPVSVHVCVCVLTSPTPHSHLQTAGHFPSLLSVSFLPLSPYHLISTETPLMTALVYSVVVTPWAWVRCCMCVSARARALKLAHVPPVMTAAVYNVSSWQGSFAPPSLPRPLSGVTRVRVDDDVIFSPLCDL